MILQELTGAVGPAHFAVLQTQFDRAVVCQVKDSPLFTLVHTMRPASI